MRSIRAKTMLLTVFAVVVTLSVAMILGVVAIKDLGSRNADKMLDLLCEAGEKNLDSYFESTEKSVDIVTAFIETDLVNLSEEALKSHIERTREIFARTANKANGLLTYYYRIDPSVSKTEPGFWYVNLDGTGFTEHEPSNLSLSHEENDPGLVWFTVPKKTGRSIWLPPYITENLSVRVISYNEPVYFKDRFIGVVGIEIDYSTMAEQVNRITLFENGYAFLTDENGNLVYHPQMDVAKMSPDAVPKTPMGLRGKQTSVRYVYNGVEKQAARRQMNNGMWLNVSVPVSEINDSWQRLIWELAAVSVILLLVFILLSLQMTKRIAEPLRKLTDAAKQVNAGNYDVELDYEGNDEVGILTYTFRQLIRNLRSHISDLNSLAYADALTAAYNKSAYDADIRELQTQLRNAPENLEFAIGIFDCDNLKRMNDQYGHDKGDIYLKSAASMIKRVFAGCPVFRIGGDEFAVILQGENYQRRTELACKFEELSAESCRSGKLPWEQVHTSMGIAAYRPEADRTVTEVVRRADQMMYETKLSRKAVRKDGET